MYTRTSKRPFEHLFVLGLSETDKHTASTSPSFRTKSKPAHLFLQRSHGSKKSSINHRGDADFYGLSHVRKDMLESVLLIYLKDVPMGHNLSFFFLLTNQIT